MDRTKIHVVNTHRVQKNTRKSSAKLLSDTTGNAEQRNVEDLKRVESVRRQLKEALRELEQIEFELEGGCLW